MIHLMGAHQLRKERVFRDRYDPLDNWTDEELLKQCRFDRASILFICDLLKDPLEHKTKRNHALPLHLQVILSLRYFATGSMQSVLGNIIHVEQCTVSRTIKRTTLALVNIARDFIKFPTGALAATTKQQFYNLAGFPNVLGAVDGTHIRIQSPVGGLSQCFYCRKGYPTINVQVSWRRLKYSILSIIYFSVMCCTGSRWCKVPYSWCCCKVAW